MRLALVLALGLCLVSPTCGLLLKNLVDTFALGHSMAKTYLLLIFLLAVTCPPLGRVRPLPDLKGALSLGLLLCGTLALGEQLWYSHLFDLGLSAWSAVVRDGYWSLTELDHIHVCKAMLAPLFGELAATTDAGFPFASLFPRALLYAHLTLFVSVLGLAYLASLRAFQALGTGRALSLTLCVFTLVKNCVDGGPLNPEVMAALPIFCSLLWSWRVGRVALALTLVYAMSLPFWTDRAVLTMSTRLPAVALVLLLPMLWEQEKLGGRAKKAVGLMVLLIPLYFMPLVRSAIDPTMRWQPNALNLLVYARRGLPAGQRVWVLTSRPDLVESSSSLRVTDRTPVGPFTQVGASLLRPSTPAELCQEFRLPISRRPINWIPSSVKMEMLLRPAAGGAWKAPSSPLLQSARVELRGSDTWVELTLAPGANRDLAIALLGPGLLLLKEARLSYPALSQAGSSPGLER